LQQIQQQQFQHHQQQQQQQQQAQVLAANCDIASETTSCLRILFRTNSRVRRFNRPEIVLTPRLHFPIVVPGPLSPLLIEAMEQQEEWRETSLSEHSCKRPKLFNLRSDSTMADRGGDPHRLKFPLLPSLDTPWP
jgi:hypothetical protein